MGELEELQKKIVKFRDEREWKKFHNPKELAADIVIEAAELMEIFMWRKKDDELEARLEEKRKEVEQELADIFISALLFAADAKINVKEAVEKKLAINERKYPIEKSKGRCTKWNEL